MTVSQESDSLQVSSGDRIQRETDPEPARCILTVNPHSRSAAASEADLVSSLRLAGFEILGGGPISGDRLGGFFGRRLTDCGQRRIESCVARKSMTRPRGVYAPFTWL